MRVLQTARRYLPQEWGGTETVIREFSRELVDMGHETELWTSAALSKPGTALIDGLVVRRFKHHYPFFGLDTQAQLAMDKKGGNLISASLFAALLGTRPFDIYHLHTGKRFGAEVASAARIHKRPYVITLHGGVLNVPDEERRDLLAPIQGKLEWGKALGALLGSRSLLERADAVFCVNAEEADELRQRMPGQRVLHMPNGVHPERYAHGDGQGFRKRYGLKEEDRVILCISRIDPQKNQLALVQALPKLSIKEPAVHVVLIGPVTDAAYADRMLDDARKSGVADRVHLLPALPHGSAELADAYAAADVFALSSRHEPFGIVVLEAWSAGLPVIASNIGGLGRLVTDGQNGKQIEPNSSDELSQAISELLSDLEFANRLAENGHRTAVQSYSWSRITQDIVNTYEEILHDK